MADHITEIGLKSRFSAIAVSSLSHRLLGMTRRLPHGHFQKTNPKSAVPERQASVLENSIKTKRSCALIAAADSAVLHFVDNQSVLAASPVFWMSDESGMTLD
jgi:hypothetical protein